MINYFPESLNSVYSCVCSANFYESCLMKNQLLLTVNNKNGKQAVEGLNLKQVLYLFNILEVF